MQGRGFREKMDMDSRPNYGGQYDSLPEDKGLGPAKCACASRPHLEGTATVMQAHSTRRRHAAASRQRCTWSKGERQFVGLHDL